jgi:sensor histidine kinase YesM
MKVALPKWYRFFYRAIIVLFTYSLLLELLFVITGNLDFVVKGHVGTMVLNYVMGFLFFVPLFKVKNPLKYYIITGLLFLVFTNLMVSIIKRMDLTYDQKEIRYSIFYIGTLIENLFFSLALGHRQKIILDQRNESRDRLIKQLRKNEKLQKEAEQKLQKDIEVLSKQAKIDRLERQQARYDKTLAEMKISALQSQMNPHFIFNSLNSIKRYIIDNEKENAVYYLNKFSKLIRRVLATTREKEISLADELETMELYVGIENIRFNKSIDFKIEIEEGLQVNTIKVPTLILQPFLENAIWHGLSLKDGKKKLEIKIEKKGKKYIEIHIIDNGIGRKRSAEIKKKKIHQRDSIGIKLTEERLKNFAKGYKSKYALVYTDLEDHNLNITGTKVTLQLPIV